MNDFMLNLSLSSSSITFNGCLGERCDFEDEEGFQKIYVEKDISGIIIIKV